MNTQENLDDFSTLLCQKLNRSLAEIITHFSYLVFTLHYAIDDNELYGFGSNNVGELNGIHEHDESTELNPTKIKVPCKGKILQIKASNSRSVVFTDSGEIWYWGGMTYCEGNKRTKIKGFHLLNEEPQIVEMAKKGEKIIDYCPGLMHEVILTEHSK